MGNSRTTPDDISTRTSSAVTLAREGAWWWWWWWCEEGGGLNGRARLTAQDSPGQEEEGEQGGTQHADLEEEPPDGAVVRNDVRHVPVTTTHSRAGD